ncbi:39S ribosomal protein L9, mitochondrial-like [Eriocheir sinensis]|uniref:39S ribosomal protein L9, mitochondrial-like n=1 Tax=Eriocheir sinensis TaxID=95602 RepID=UPI0021C94223|nr:39S ribosomal protein L9, mitochondrial-like [Eriocheir sinensis]
MLRSMVQGLSCLRLHGTGLAQSVATKESVCASGAAARALPQPILQHVRTTFILKHERRVELVKAYKNPRSRRLKARHFLYDLVENIDVKKQEPVKVILKTSVEGLGSRGQVVEVSPHKARNQLLLPGLAVYASPENLEKYSSLIADVSQEDQPSSPFALSTSKLLSEMVIYLNMNKDNPWVLEPWHVRVSFRKAGVMVPEEALTLPPHTIAGPDLALQGKEFAVMVKINNKEEAAVRCRINHFASNPKDRLLNQGRFWELPGDPLFPEQAPLLEELNRRDKRIRSTAEDEEED